VNRRWTAGSAAAERDVHEDDALFPVDDLVPSRSRSEVLGRPAPVLRSSSVHTELSDRRSAQARAAATAREAARPLPRGLVRRFFRLVADVVRKSDRDRLLGLAGENAFAAVLCVFPMLIVFAAVLGQLSDFIGAGNARAVEKAVLDFLRETLTDNADSAIETAENLFNTAPQTLTLALVLGLASMAQAFASVINTVTLTYDVADSRGWWRRRFLGLLLGIGSVILGAVLLILIVVGPLYAASDVVAKVGFSDEYAFVFSYLRWPVAFVSLVLWATTMFHICPDRAGPWRRGLPGALLTSVLWLGASVGFNVYLDVAIGESPVFTALGGGLILITWLWLLCFSLLIGAELNAVLLARRVAFRGATTEVLDVRPGEITSVAGQRMRRRRLLRGKATARR
jgi:membrane protein